MTASKLDEQKTAKASLLLNFFNEVQQLKHEEAVYHNLLIELKARFGSNDFTKIPDNDKNLLVQQCQTVRYYAMVSFRSYKSISANIKREKDDKKEKRPDEYIEEIRNPKQPIIIDLKVLGDYVDSLLLFLTEDIIKTLLESSQEIIDKVY